MSERLSELSASVSLELNTRLQESNGRIKAAQKIIDGTRKEPPAQVDGIHLILDQIVELLEEVDTLHIGALKQIGDTYGHVSVLKEPNGTEGTAAATREHMTEDTGA